MAHSDRHQRFGRYEFCERYFVTRVFLLVAGIAFLAVIIRIGYLNAEIFAPSGVDFSFLALIILLVSCLPALWLIYRASLTEVLCERRAFFDRFLELLWAFAFIFLAPLLIYRLQILTSLPGGATCQELDCLVVLLEPSQMVTHYSLGLSVFVSSYAFISWLSILVGSGVLLTAFVVSRSVVSPWDFRRMKRRCQRLLRVWDNQWALVSELLSLLGETGDFVNKIRMQAERVEFRSEVGGLGEAKRLGGVHVSELGWDLEKLISVPDTARAAPALFEEALNRFRAFNALDWRHALVDDIMESLTNAISAYVDSNELLIKLRDQAYPIEALGAPIPGREDATTLDRVVLYADDDQVEALREAIRELPGLADWLPNKLDEIRVELTKVQNADEALVRDISFARDLLERSRFPRRIEDLRTAFSA